MSEHEQSPEARRIEEALRSAHSGFYLTLVSITQGLALGYLLQVAGGEFHLHGTIGVVTAAQYFVAMFFLVMIWHEYAMGTVLFNWRLGLVDSVIPFMFGVAEYFMINVVEIPIDGHHLSASRLALWLLSLAIMAAVSCVAYINQSTHVEPDQQTRFPGSLPKQNLIHASWTCVLLAALAAFCWTRPVARNYEWAVAIAVLMLFVVHGARYAIVDRRSPLGSNRQVGG